jgi:glutamyl-tRNA synthetase
MQYDEDGYLPEAVLNYLARLGWSHGDDEIFDMAQFCQWFDLDHITPSAAQFNTEKLNWLNAHYLKLTDNTRLAAEVTRRLAARNIASAGGPDLAGVVELYKERAATLNELADAVAYFYQQNHATAELLEKHLTPDVRPVLTALAARLAAGEWTQQIIHDAIQEAVTSNGLKFPKVAMPLRVMVTGIAQSPSIDEVMALLGRDEVLHRISSYL